MSGSACSTCEHLSQAGAQDRAERATRRAVKGHKGKKLIMGNTYTTIARKVAAVLLAACLVLGMCPAIAQASDPYGTDVGTAPRSEGSQGMQLGTDVNIAVKGSLAAETTPARIVFRSPDALTDADRYLTTEAEGGSHIKGAADGLPYEYAWTRLVYDTATKTYAPEPADSPYRMARVTTAAPAGAGMRMTYDLKSDTYQIDTLYKYVLTVKDALGQSVVNEIDVFCGNEYIYGTITNGKGDKREADAQAASEPTVVDVTALRLWDSELVVSDLGPEGRAELYPYARGEVMDAAASVSLVSESATPEKPVFLTPPKVKLAIRLHDQSVEEGWPVRVLSIQEGRVVEVSEPDAKVEVDEGGWKVARVGVPGEDESGVEALGVFAVVFPPPGGDDDLVSVTSQAGMPHGIDGWGEASVPGGRVAPADDAAAYPIGTSVRYTFIPDAGYAFDFATLGTAPDGAQNPRVTSATEHVSLGANFVDLEVYRPASGDELFLTAYFKHVGSPTEPVDPDPGVPDPDEPDGPRDPLATHVVSAWAGPGGVISPAGEFLVRTGEDITFTVVPDAGFAPDEVLVNGKPAQLVRQPGGTYTLTLLSVRADMSVAVTFKESPGSQVTEEPYRVTVSSTGPGMAHPAGQIQVAPGAPFMVTLVPDEGCRLLKVTLNGADVTEDVAANLTYAIAQVRADARIEATFCDAAGSTDPVAPERTLITTRIERLHEAGTYGAVGGAIVPVRAVVGAGEQKRFEVRPCAGSYAVWAKMSWTDGAGVRQERALDLRELPLPSGATAPAGTILKPYLYVEVPAEASKVELTVAFDACERDPENPGGGEYIYPDDPVPAMQHEVAIEQVTEGGGQGGVVTAARNGQLIGAAPARVLMDHDGTLSLTAIPYGGYAARFEVVEGDLAERADSQGSVPSIGGIEGAHATPVSQSYAVRSDARVRVVFYETGGYTPPVPDAGNTLIRAVSAGPGEVAPAFAQVAKGAPAAAFALTPAEGCRITSVKLYDETAGKDASGKLPGVASSGGTIELPYLGDAAYALVVIFGKAGEGPDGPSVPEPDKVTLTAKVGRDMAQYTGEGTVAIEGSDAVDAAGDPVVSLAPGERATVVFMPGANSTLRCVTISYGAGAPQEVSVLGHRLTITAGDADIVVRAYFEHGTFIEHVDLDITYGQNLTPEECGWELTAAPADKVPYGDAITVSVLPVEGSERASDYKLTSLTVAGVEYLGALGRASDARAASSPERIWGSFLYPSVTEDTHVQATFAYDPPKGPDEPDGPDDPDKPDGPDDPDTPIIPDGRTITIHAVSEGHGTISPSGDVRVRAGQAASFTLRPEVGYQPVSVSITDSRGTRTRAQTTSQLTVTSNEDATVVVRFAPQAYPGPNDTASRVVRRLQALAKTGDAQAAAALGLTAIACGAAGVLYLAAARRKRKAEEE